MISESKTIGELWKESLTKYGGKIAVKDENTEFTFSQADLRISKIRSYLTDSGVKAGDRIAVEACNSVGFWLAAMAIVTQGCAYVPIFPSCPEERKEYMIKDSKAVLFLKEEKTQELISGFLAPINLDICDSPDSPCYVIYTSGTTGTPKGVQIIQSWLINLCIWYKNTAEIEENSLVLSLNSLCFDASVKNIFTPFMVGAATLMNIQNSIDINGLYNHIKKNSPTHINATPGVIDVLLQEAEEEEYDGLKSVCCIISGGEAFQKGRLSDFYKKSGKNLRVINVYGPTECTSVTTSHILTAEELTDEKKVGVSIGTPIRKKRIVIVDDNGRRCNAGKKGELYIGGEGVANGYLNDEARSIEKFVIYDNEHFYKSGDICYSDDNGQIYYCGRKDNQIKLNGYRIELDEISERLVLMNGIKAVKSFFINNMIISCYSSDAPKDEISLKEFLGKALPEYMIPKYFVHIDGMPLTERGKIASEKLKEYVISLLSNRENRNENEYDEIQKRVVGIWEKLLGIRNIGITDNFFDVGGNSLKLYKMGKMIEKEFGIKVEPLFLMELSSVKRVSDFVNEKIKKG